MKRSGMFLLLLLGSVLQSPAQVKDPEQPVSAFSLALYRQLIREQPGENLFIAPLSVYAVLAMLLDGAAGKTRQELGQVLQIPPADAAKTNSLVYLQSYCQSLRQPGQVTMANALWLDHRFPLQSAFEASVTEKYAATVKTADFAQAEQTAQKVNDWVSTSTRGTIPAMVAADAVSPQGRPFCSTPYTLRRHGKLPLMPLPHMQLLSIRLRAQACRRSLCSRCFRRAA